MLRGNRFNGVISGTPALHEAIATKHRCSHAQRRGFAAARIAAQMKAPALRFDPAHGHACKGATHCKRKAGVSNAQRSYLAAPLI